jgi:hypothetical protein
MNPINYANGLVVELGYAQQNNDKTHEAAVREQLAWVSGELDKLEPAAFRDEIREMYDGAKQAVTGALATKPKRASAAKQ